MAELRAEKRFLLLDIAARDVNGELALEDVGRALSDLADASLQRALELLGAPDDFAVIAMGKLGGTELNYSSDIDVMFIADDAERATPAAGALLRELGGASPEGQAYRIDVDLRPEGRSGALVRSLESCREYYSRWAEMWEYQALIKARPSAGSTDAGQRFIELTEPLVFAEHVDAERIASVRKMKERVEQHALRSARKAKGSEIDDVKLGPGGIRDIEFSVQLLQLVHGGSDEQVRARGTLDALSQLSFGGYMADEDAAGLAVAYRWLRTVEHRLQLWQERQVHSLPSDEGARERLGKVLGFHDGPAASAGQRFISNHQAVVMDVRARFEKLFYRPMIEALAEGGRMSEDALKDRLRVLGFRDVERAARNLTGLVAGASRRARLFRVITPAFLRWLARNPLPDEGLLSFLKLGELLEGRPDLLGRLRDNPPALELLARVLGSGRLLGDVLLHVPEEVGTIAAEPASRSLKTIEQLIREGKASLSWRDPDQRLDGLRRFKRREMLRIAVSDVAGEADVEQVGPALSDLAAACLEAALEDAAGFAVIAMGKLGGRELTYASDIDVMFVHSLEPAEAERRAEALMQAIGSVTPEGQAFRIDAGLRPEGKAGVLARSLESFEEYYTRWAQPWEYLALLKARFVAGDAALGERFIDLGARFSHREQASAALGEIRHLKARMEKERIPRGTDPRRNSKMGPGGSADVEFAVQLIQFQHSGRVPELCVSGTLEALGVARKAGLLPDSDAQILSDAYRFLIRMRNRLFLLYGRPVDALPVKPEELEALGVAMGFTDQPRQQMEEAYLKITRRARRVSEPLIYGSRAG